MNLTPVFVMSILAALFGSALSGFSGFVMGGALGFLGSLILELRQRVIDSEQRLSRLEKRLTSIKQKELETTTTPDEAITPLTKAHIKTEALIQTEKTVSISTPPPLPIPSPESEKQSLEAEHSRAWNSAKPENMDLEKILAIGLDFLKRYFTEGNLIVRIGVIVLFFGFSFLVKYSIENSLVPIEIRMAFAFLTGMVMLGAGWYLRNKNEKYALVIQGGAVAINFLTIFASFKLYGLISASFAFPLLILFSALSMALAVLQNSRSLAVIGITGGFAAPIMASTGEGNHVVLFSYYLILNLAIFFTAWFKSWRMLNVIGFAFTFAIGTAWGVTQYSHEDFASTEPFLVIFFLLYVAIAILFAHKQPPELKGYVDGTLIFGTPIIAFSLQSALVKDTEFGMAVSSMILGVFYLCIARLLWNNKNENFRLLTEALLAIGVIFATLTIPLAFDGRWTAATWAIEGAGLLWVGIRQNRTLVKYFGMAIQILGGAIFLFHYPYLEMARPFLNSEFTSCLLVAIAGFFSSYQIAQHSKKLSEEQSEEQNKTFSLSRLLIILFAAYASLWWIGAGFSQVQGTWLYDTESNHLILYFALSALLTLVLGAKYRWQVSPAFPWLTLAPVMLLEFIWLENGQALSGYGFIVWLLFFASIIAHLHFNKNNKTPIVYPEHLHITFWLMLLTLCYFEIKLFIYDLQLSPAWQVSAAALILVCALYLLDWNRFWPSRKFPTGYHRILVPLILLVMLLWGINHNVMALLKTGVIPYLPLVNPVDITQAIMLLAAIRWFQTNKLQLGVQFSTLQTGSVLGGILFLWFNIIMFKTIHLLTDIPYSFSTLFDSAIVQMSISISWTIVGLAIMVLASKKDIRQLWFVGAAITGIIVAKLFLIDLSGQGTVERIISFLSVGALLLIVGYFSPIPPEKKLRKFQTTNNRD